jgi:leucyl aminopeptidase (aminopeptidase T)
MKRALAIAVLGIVIVGMARLYSRWGAEAAPRSDEVPDLRTVALNIVRQSAGVQPGDLVWIRGGADDVHFMEYLAVAVGAEGGHPLISVSSDEVMRRWYREVDERYDAQREEWTWQMYERADVSIVIQSTDYSIYAEIPEHRLRAWDNENAGLVEVIRRRGVREVRIGNGLYPAAWQAAMLGVELADLKSAFFAGLSADPLRLADSGARLKEILGAAENVRIRHANGTDLRVSRGRGAIIVSDGRTSVQPELEGADSVLNMTWLPAGEVTLALDPHRTEGRLVVERLLLDGQVLGPMTLVYSNGKLQSLDSETDVAPFRAYIESDGALSDRLTGLKIGINPQVTDGRMLPWMGAGVVSVSMGSNVLLGGDIDLPFYFFLTLVGATIHVEDRLVVENGVLMLPGVTR